MSAARGLSSPRARSIGELVGAASARPWLPEVDQYEPWCPGHRVTGDAREPLPARKGDEALEAQSHPYVLNEDSVRRAHLHVSEVLTQIDGEPVGRNGVAATQVVSRAESPQEIEVAIEQRLADQEQRTGLVGGDLRAIAAHGGTFDRHGVRPGEVNVPVLRAAIVVDDEEQVRAVPSPSERDNPCHRAADASVSTRPLRAGDEIVLAQLAA